MPPTNQPNPDVDRIVHDFQDGQKNGDYSHAIFELHQLQQKEGYAFGRDAQQINSRLKELGFNDLNIVGTDNAGHLITRSQDGKQLQTRDPIHAEVESSKDAGQTTQEKWGTHGREFTVNPDGSAHYQAKKDDLYWNVVGDALQQKLGRKPTATEIANTLQQMAKAEGKKVTDYNTIHPGDKMDIPMPAAGGDGTYKVQKPGNEGANSDRSNILNPPGARPQDAHQDDRTKEESTFDNETGMSTRHSVGQLDDNVMPRGMGGQGTKFDTSEVRDRSGNLISRDIKYPDGYTGGMLITDDQGQMRNLGNVSELHTRFNNYSGNYETTVKTKDGHTYRIQNDKDGKVTKVTDDPPVYTVPMASPF